jgi:hypothetical protein
MAFEKGNKLGKGRPPKADEEKANALFLSALKEVYDTETDDETKIAFIKDSLLDSQRGQIFIAEHLFGKPKEIHEQNVNLNNFSLKDVISFDKTK